MWIFLNDAFLSVVLDTHSVEGDLLVRARRREDIERTFPAAKIQRTPSRDYGWRTTLPRQIVAAAIASAVSTIDYGNFKESVQEGDRHDAYMRVWSTMIPFKKPRRANLPRSWNAAGEPEFR